ncbi:MAG TPA: hypothetical protein EYH44_01100 [Thermoprotei archaeon]|nr:hypothetical protein [Thermoprotei archaeon]
MIIEGRVFYRGSVRELYLFIDGGVIKDIRLSIDKSQSPNIRFMDRGNIILPGFIDIHVHLRDFEQAYKEDFYTGTASAAAGGVTVVFDMPNTVPRNNRLSILQYRDSVADKKSVVDYGLYYGLPPNLDELFGFEDIAIGMKVYPDDLHSYKIDHISDVMIYNHAKDIVTVFHAEEPDGYISGDDSPSIEREGIKYIAGYTKSIGLPTHITHVTCRSFIFDAKNIYTSLTVDSTPHHIMLSSEDLKYPYGRVRPPLRDRECVESLVKELNGLIDIYATDHAPHTWEEKMDGFNGFPGLETAYNVLATLYNKGVLSLNRIVELYSTNPAIRFKLDNILGYIEVGYLANLTVVDLYSSVRVDPTKFFSKAKHSPFDGMKLYGRVISTFVRGVEVYNGEDITVKPGYGVNIKSFKRGFK